MPSFPPAAVDDDWAAEIAEEARTEMRGRIEVCRPGKPTKYDPKTDTGGRAQMQTIIGARPGDETPGRPARIQHIRLPLEQSGAAEWATKRRYRFQIDLFDDDPVIEKGMIVRVLDGGRDGALAAYAFEVLSASGSSNTALRTIETVTEFAKAA
jgi:hypothetical protein